MRILPDIGRFRRLVYAAILSENHGGFDDQDFLELLSQSMWCLRNATRGFGEDASKFARRASAGKLARPTMPGPERSGATKNPRQFLPGVLLESCQTIGIRSYAERGR
jgi:hypothetical protein